MAAVSTLFELAISSNGKLVVGENPRSRIANMVGARAKWSIAFEATCPDRGHISGRIQDHHHSRQ